MKFVDEGDWKLLTQTQCQALAIVTPLQSRIEPLQHVGKAELRRALLEPSQALGHPGAGMDARSHPGLGQALQCRLQIGKGLALRGQRVGLVVLTASGHAFGRKTLPADFAHGFFEFVIAALTLRPKFQGAQPLAAVGQTEAALFPA